MASIKCSTCAETRHRIEGVIASLDNPRHRRMLQVWLKHWWSEVVYDIDGIMETVTETISYRWYGTEEIGDGIHEDSREFARNMYQAQFAAGLMPGGPIDRERWAFNDWGLTLEGLFTGAFPGSLLKGKSTQSESNGLYLVQWPMMVSTPFDPNSGLMAGELMYAGAPRSIEPTDRETIRRLLGHD